MYVSIGNGKYLKQSEIVGIFDMDTATICIATRNFLSEAQKRKVVAIVDDDIPKSFVLTAHKRKAKETEKKEKVYLCKLSSGVLFSRSHSTGGIGQGVETDESTESE